MAEKNSETQIVFEATADGTIHAKVSLVAPIENTAVTTESHSNTTDVRDDDAAHIAEIDDDAISESNSQQFIVDENVSFSSNSLPLGCRPNTPPRMFCRICQEKNLTERNISPCDCRGTLSLVHKSCLEQWLVASDSNRCELCGHTYSILRKPRYPVLKSLWIWLTDPTASRDRGHFLKDLTRFILSAPFVLLINHFAYINMAYVELMLDLDEEGLIWVTDDTSILKLTGGIFLLTAASFLNGCYWAWCVMNTDMYIRKWYQWHRRQCSVTLQLSDH